VAPVARPVETTRSPEALLAENVALRSELAANKRSELAANKSAAAGRRTSRRRR
jgi:hypothetical protein